MLNFFSNETLAEYMPHAKKIPRKKKSQIHKSKSWNVSNPYLSKEEEEETLGTNKIWMQRLNKVDKQMEVFWIRVEPQPTTIRAHN